MNITRIMLAAAMAAGLGVTSATAAQANVTATIDIVNNNASTAIYHAKNPPSTQTDMFSRVGLAWTTLPPNSLLAGASDATAKITLGANEYVEFAFGSPNGPGAFTSGCVFRITANATGTGLASATGSKIGSLASCAGSLPSGQPYNAKVTVAGF